MIRLRPRTDADNGFIETVTRRELVPTLERAWRFKWDDGHARKFMLDLLTVGETLVATESDERPDERLGYVWYVVQSRRRWLRPRPVFWINYLVVASDFQRRGVGSAVLDRCRELAREAGCKTMELWVQADNGGARRFYERLGFQALPRLGDNIPMRRGV